MKVQAHSFLEPPLEYNQDQTLLIDLGSYGNIMQFQISFGRENRERDTRVIKIGVIRKVLTNNFALSDAENITSRPLNGGGIANLPLFNFLIFLLKPSRDSSFLTSARIYPQICGPKYDADSVPL